jgi:hypothetical protein
LLNPTRTSSVHSDWLKRSSKAHLLASLVSDPAVDLQGEAVEGSAVDVLIDEVARASLLVLGSRQLAAPGAYLLGSVSAAVAARAGRPVVVIRGPSGEPAENPSVVVGVDGTPASQPPLEFGFDHASRHRTALRDLVLAP